MSLRHRPVIDEEFRALERAAEAASPETFVWLKAALERQKPWFHEIIRPTEDYELPENPQDGETLTFAFTSDSKFPRIWATGDMHISLVGHPHGATSTKNGSIRPEAHSPCVVRLMALMPEEIWVSLLVAGTWVIDD